MPTASSDIPDAVKLYASTRSLYRSSSKPSKAADGEVLGPPPHLSLSLSVNLPALHEAIVGKKSRRRQWKTKMRNQISTSAPDPYPFKADDKRQTMTSSRRQAADDKTDESRDSKIVKFRSNCTQLTLRASQVPIRFNVVKKRLW